MPTINGTVRDDKWTVINPGVYTFDGLAGVDTIAWGTSQRSSYQIYQGPDGVVRVDSVSGASQSLNTSLYSIEKMTFDSGRETVDLRIEFPDAVNKLLVGTVTADAFTSTTENDGINGQQGIDSVAFSGPHANYAVKKVTHFGFTTITVKDKTGVDGTDTLQSIERLQFTDVSVNLQVKGIAAAAPLADVQRISELYVAFFNRTPDADGLAYWIGQKMAGQSINQISEAFYNIGASPTYSSLTGFSTSMSNNDFLNVFYKNVLGRPEGVDAGGLAYWNGKLADGSSTRSSLANDILESAHTFKGNSTWGWVADLLDNKIAVANTIAVQWGLTYNTDAYARGVAIAAAITPTDTTVALALVGVSAADLNIA
jgi:serralysin